MFQEEEVVNSCRVCRSPNQDGDYECLYVVQVIEESGVMQSHAWQLTNTGKLYEEMLGVEVNPTRFFSIVPSIFNRFHLLD